MLCTYTILVWYATPLQWCYINALAPPNTGKSTVQQFVQTNSKNTPQHPSLLELCQDNPPMSGEFHHRWPVLWKTIPCHGDITWWSKQLCPRLIYGIAFDSLYITVMSSNSRFQCHLSFSLSPIIPTVNERTWATDVHLRTLPAKIFLKVPITFIGIPFPLISICRLIGSVFG